MVGPFILVLGRPVKRSLKPSSKHCVSSCQGMAVSFVWAGKAKCEEGMKHMGCLSFVPCTMAKIPKSFDPTPRLIVYQSRVLYVFLSLDLNKMDVKECDIRLLTQWQIACLYFVYYLLGITLFIYICICVCVCIMYYNCIYISICVCNYCMYIYIYLEVSKNGGSSKWWVYNRKSYLKWMI